MKTKCQAEAVAIKLGATLEIINVSNLDVTAIPPDGMLWNASDAHVLVYAQELGCKASEVWKPLIQDMEEGLRKCVDPECTICVPS